MSELKSIFDGWTKQIYFKGLDGNGGFCARGFAFYHCDEMAVIYAAEERVGKYIQAHYELPEEHVHEFSGVLMRPAVRPADAIIYANNILKLTPEDFRRIDRESQIAEGMAAAEALVESAAVVEVAQ